jgi:3',5'-cyclic AMP phosphodiesterase CpdA
MSNSLAFGARRLALSFVVAFSALILGCATPPASSPGTLRPISFLAVGDTGYHYDYLEAEDYEPPLTLQEFLAKERADWLEDHLPEADFQPSPAHVLASNGGVVAASGLDAVARAMRTWCESRPCDFATMLGDNIYPDGATAGADGRDDDERFRKLFIEPYGPLAESSADFRMYVTLGNHDWRTSLDGVLSQVRFHENTPPFFMDGFSYRAQPPVANGTVELFVIDTEMLLSRVQVPETAVAADGSGALLEELEAPKPWTRQQAAAGADGVAWLEAALASSTARWKIVMGHHPLWSTAGSKFAQAEALRRLILPVLCRHADLYLAGHEHTLELHRDDCSVATPDEGVAPLLQVVSGAGAKQRPHHPAFSAWQQANNPQLETLYAKGMVWGFAHVELLDDQLRVRVVSTPNDGSGQPVEEFTLLQPRRSGASMRTVQR